ncbi:cobalt-precorrin 5A hydrolase [Desulfovibrio inopinatus]|uniref:cobalt-precorrin 5A hydrolase n=1 Tax=Desulfovibrio inopinatus TaxID=102109 RepID=UPI0003FC4FBA|nr:cobalamin biosynthesis protein [Desulfovibrio inopinatus]
MNIAIYALTPDGARLGDALRRAFDGTLFLPMRWAREHNATGFERIVDAVAEGFERYDGLIFLTACGIAVRSIAPLLQGKTKDPAVVVMDQAGRFAISLLSGHLGGANGLAEHIAAVTGGTAVITTATDVIGAPAIDIVAKQARLRAAHDIGFREIAAALAAGEPVSLFDPQGLLPLTPKESGCFVWASAPLGPAETDPEVVVDFREHRNRPGRLVLHPPVLVAGVGCRKEASAEDILECITLALSKANLAAKSVAIVTSIDAKSEEPGLLAAATALSAKTLFFSAEELGSVTTPTPSRTVERHMGVKNVCEAAAMLAAQTNRLLVTKVKTQTATTAIARIQQPV